MRSVCLRMSWALLHSGIICHEFGALAPVTFYLFAIELQNTFVFQVSIIGVIFHSRPAKSHYLWQTYWTWVDKIFMAWFGVFILLPPLWAARSLLVVTLQLSWNRWQNRQRVEQKFMDRLGLNTQHLRCSWFCNISSDMLVLVLSSIIITLFWYCRYTLISVWLNRCVCCIV